MPEPSLSIARAFVEGFTGSAETVMRFHAMLDRPGPYGRGGADVEARISEIWPHFLEAQKLGFGIFFYLNQVKRGEGSGQDGIAKNIDVEKARAVAIDDPEGGYPSNWHLAPDIAIRTSRKTVGDRRIQKVQALWLLDGECSFEEFGVAQRRLAKHYSSDAIFDLRRVLRLPGTLHLKDPEHPQLVTFDCPYRGHEGRPLSAIMKGLPRIPVSRKPVAQWAYNAAAARHPFNIERGRKAFLRAVAEYAAAGGIREGDRHRAMFRLAVIALGFTDDAEIVKRWCVEEAFDLLVPGRYAPEDFEREVENALAKRKAEGTLAGHAFPVSWIEGVEFDVAAELDLAAGGKKR